MTVYVDPLMPTIPTDKWPFRFACHMIADSEMELHQFARRIGLRFEWYQPGKPGQTLGHYDLNPGRRRRALAEGAVQISSKEIVRKIMAMRAEAATGDYEKTNEL